MQGLIDDLLAYSRAGRGETTEPTDVGAVLDGVLKTLTVSIEESGAVITHDPLPTITSNPVELTQVFQNLIGNAIKFRGQRKPEIHVGARRQADGWLFTVRDNGIGIDPQFADRIFHDLPAPAHAGTVSGHRDRPGDMQEDRGASRRPDLGGVPAGRGLDVLLYDS